MDVVLKLALDGVLYMPALDSDIRPGADLGKAATLNRVLRKLYPKDQVVDQTELVMVLDDDQVILPVSIRRFEHALMQDADSNFIEGCDTHRLSEPWSCDLQIVDKAFLTVMLPYLKREGVRLVSSQPGFENVSASGDVFNQVCLEADMSTAWTAIAGF